MSFQPPRLNPEKDRMTAYVERLELAVRQLRLQTFPLELAAYLRSFGDSPPPNITMAAMVAAFADRFDDDTESILERPEGC
jgi:hypothetical protein